MNRRKFFAFLPLAPAALITEGVRTAAASQAPPDHVISLTLMGTTKKSEKINGPYYENSSISIFTGAISDPNKQVSMAVGEDGELWIRPKDKQWKKVVTQ